MLILGHAGITLGAITALERAREGLKGGGADSLPSPAKSNWFARLAARLDIRVLLLGSLLADIIDKPLGHLLFADSLSNGRIFGHTLLFTIILAAIGWWLYHKRRRVWLLTLAAASFCHLVCDQMWLAPRTFFWPVFGFAFDKYVYDDYLSGLWEGLLHNPAVYVPEIIGLLILAWFGFILLRRRRFIAFLRRGEV